jgi:signal transduction histidine kinase
LDVVDLLTPLAEENRQLLSCDETTGPIANVDATMIQQLLVNLIQNAISHAGDDVEISVSVDVGEDSSARGVSDNGKGIPAEKIESVHDAFVRLDSARTQPGSGLGLTLCQAIVDHHNGRMILTNLNPGLNVDIELPII